MSSQASDFTSASMEYISKHARARDVESNPALQKLTLYNHKSGIGGLSRRYSSVERDRKLRIEDAPVRFLHRQNHATKGVRDIRLFTWAYIRRHDPEEVVDAVAEVASSGGKKGGGKKGMYGGGKSSWREAAHRGATHFGPLQRMELRDKLKDSPIYHFVGRGNDPVFTPPDDKAITEMVFSYFANPIHEIREYLLERLDFVIYGLEETGESADMAFHDLMADAGFADCLKRYFEEGDTERESSLHLAGRLRGGNCFLYRAIKENEVELVKLLLTNHVPEVTRDKKWLRLAEPCSPAGSYKNTAFHEAAYYARYECLEVLLEYARRFGIDITKFRNEEDRRTKTGHSILETAEKQQNWRCYNLLAPVFGVAKRLSTSESEGAVPSASGDDAEAVDQNPREKIRERIVTPRVECSFTYTRSKTGMVDGVSPKGKIVVTHDFKTLTDELDPNSPSAAVSWSRFFEDSLSFFRGLKCGFVDAKGERMGDPEHDQCMVRVVLPSDELQSQLHLPTGIATITEGEDKLSESLMNWSGEFRAGEGPQMMSAYKAGFLLQRMLVEKEKVDACSLHTEFFCLRLCGPGTSCIFEGVSGWLRDLSENIFTPDFIEGPDISVHVGTLAFRSCFASHGEIATAAWLRALYDYVITSPAESLLFTKPKVYFRTLPAIAEYDEETIEHSSRLPKNHVEEVSQLVRRYYEDILLKRSIFLDLNYNSAMFGCFPQQEIKESFPEAIVRALEFALTPANMVRYMFSDILMRHNQSGAGVTLLGSDPISGMVNRVSLMEDFKSSLTFCGAAETLYNRFFDEKRLLTEHPRDVLEILDVRVIDFVQLLLQAWFSLWPAANDKQSDGVRATRSPDSWLQFTDNLLDFSRCADRHSCDGTTKSAILEEIVPSLQVAFDKVLSSFLRQFVVLDYALKKRDPARHEEHGNFFGWFEAQIPTGAFEDTGRERNRCALHLTYAKLRSYQERYSTVRTDVRLREAATGGAGGV